MTYSNICSFTQKGDNHFINLPHSRYLSDVAVYHILLLIYKPHFTTLHTCHIFAIYYICSTYYVCTTYCLITCMTFCHRCNITTISALHMSQFANYYIYIYIFAFYHIINILCCIFLHFTTLQMSCIAYTNILPHFHFR